MMRILIVSSAFLLFFTQTVHAIRCWECNSNINPLCSKWDPKPFVPVDCSHPSPSVLPALQDAGIQINKTGYLIDDNFGYCRKVIQKVNGVEQVLRSCGYLNETNPENNNRLLAGACLTRGSSLLSMTYCNCYSDECNSAPSLASIVWLLPLSLLFALMVAMRPLH